MSNVKIRLFEYEGPIAGLKLVADGIDVKPEPEKPQSAKPAEPLPATVRLTAKKR